MTFTPLVDFRSTTIFKAFILNAFLIALVAGMSIELRGYIDVRKETKDLPRLRKMLITIVGTILIGLTLFILGRFFVGYGGGLLAPPEKYSSFF